MSTVLDRVVHSPPTRRNSGLRLATRAAAWVVGLASCLSAAAIPAQQPPAELLPPAAGRPVATAQPVTIADVMAMQRAGLDDQVIINLIRQNGMATALATAELISLRQHGVSNQVISAMQAAAPPVAASLPLESPPAVVASRPTVVRVYEPPPVIIRTYPAWRPYCDHPHYHLQYGRGYHHGHGRSSTSVSFGFHWR